MEAGLEEMVAMVNERWLATHIPLLVLSCVPESETPRIPCCDVVTKLNLASLNRPWQVKLPFESTMKIRRVETD